LFATAQAQIGVYSTALFEGLAFGLRTFIADLPGASDMAPLVEAGLAELVSNAQQLCSALERTTSPLDRSRIDEIWTKDPHARFCEAMKAIL
jgi:hypothetical protein